MEGRDSQPSSNWNLARYLTRADYATTGESFSGTGFRHCTLSGAGTEGDATMLFSWHAIRLTCAYFILEVHVHQPH